MKKFLKVFFSIIGILVLVLVIAWTAVDISKYILYADYYDGYKAACDIPDIHSGFTPQGITYLPGSDAYLQSGYDGEHLALYYVKGDDHRKLLPLDTSGALGKGHGGGVTATDKYVYIAGDNALLRYDLATVLAAKSGDRIPCLEEIKVENAASFCFADGDKLYVGEFYRAGNYETDKSHAYTTPEGEENRAIVSCYTILETGSLQSQPDLRISIPGLVQGFAVHDGVVAISRSWGLNSSSLEFYRGWLETGTAATTDDPASSYAIPIYYIGQKNLMGQMDIPAFSEDLTVQGDRVVINFESACNKYIIGKLFFATDAGSYPFPKA